MIDLKSDQEIKIMVEAGKRLKKVVAQLTPQIRSGLTTAQIDKIADRLITQAGGEASFKKVKGYYWATCIAINEQVVHTPPSERIIKDGDILTIDIGLFYRGFHSDYADTIIVGGTKDKRLHKFLTVGELTLKKAIEQFKLNKYLGEVSKVIESEIYGYGFFVIKQLTGHGVGKKLHEDPYIPGYLDRHSNDTPLIKQGMVVAIEVIYSMGTEEVEYEDNNNWSLVTKDGSLSACFEHTVAIIGKDTIILT